MGSCSCNMGCTGNMGIVLNLNKKGFIMTMSAFLTLCFEYGIDPDIALENDNIVSALKARDDEKVSIILLEEF